MRSAGLNMNHVNASLCSFQIWSHRALQRGIPPDNMRYLSAFRWYHRRQEHMNLQRLLHAKTPLLLYIFLSLKWFQYTALKIIIEYRKALKPGGTVNSEHQWQFCTFPVSHLRLCCLQGWDQASVCTYIFSSNHCWKPARLFTHFNETTQCVAGQQGISLSPLAFKGRGIHWHELQPEFQSTFEPVTCMLCFLIYERLPAMSSSQHRLPPCSKGMPSNSKPIGKAHWGTAEYLRCYRKMRAHLQTSFPSLFVPRLSGQSLHFPGCSALAGVTPSPAWPHGSLCPTSPS